MENKKCCICGKKIIGWGNNPWGALNKKKEVIKWKDEDCCCDECDNLYVIPGRIYKMYHKEGK